MDSIPYNKLEYITSGSGPSEEEIDLAAMQYATKMSAAPDKETPDWIMTDFKAGIAWLLRYQANVSPLCCRFNKITP